MGESSVSRLSEAQRACLRLVMQGYEAKEIARQLNITPHAVVERLRAARRIVNAQSSREAARLLAAHEQDATYNRIGDNPLGIVPTPPLPPIMPSSNGSTGSAGAQPETQPEALRIQEEQAPYMFAPATPRMVFPLPFPTREHQRNDLTIVQTLVLVVGLTIALAVAGIASIALVDQLTHLRLS